MTAIYVLALILAVASGSACAVASIDVIAHMRFRDARWLTFFGWSSVGIVGLLLTFKPQMFVTPDTWPMVIFPVSLAMVYWGNRESVTKTSTGPAFFRFGAPVFVVLALTGCILIPQVAQAQTKTAKGTYTAIPALPAWEYRAGAGTGALLAGPFETLGLCNDAAEAAAAKADTAKDSTATCRPAGGNIVVKFVPVPPKPEVTWVECAIERKSRCEFTGTREVRFGTSPTITGRYAAKTVTGPTDCTNVVFGDPVVGVEKKCWTTGTLTTPPVVTPPVEPPPTTPPTTPPSTVGGVPLRESFTGFPVVGQITATAGQTISNVKVFVTSGPCIIVDQPDVTIRNVHFVGCGAGEPGKGIDLRGGARNFKTEGSYFEDVSTALYGNGASGPITFHKNYVTKIRGPMPRGQMVQCNACKTTAAAPIKVTCNVGDVKGQPNVWRNVEDWTNFYSTGNAEVAYNRLRGGGYQGYNGNPPSGTAVLFGDAAGGTNAWVHDNSFVDMTNVGIGVAGGVGARIERNKIHMDAARSGNYTNVGIYVAKYSTGTCSGHSVTDNRVWVRKADGSLNPYYFGDGSCGTVSQSGNAWNDATLDPEAMFNTVPAECQ